MKPRDITLVKNALVKSLYFTNYTIFILIDSNVNRGLSRTGCLLCALESWLKPRCDEIHDLHYYPCFIRVTELRKMRSARMFHSRRIETCM
jgi:hypothetical protein